MSDGGNIALTERSDAHGCATWEDVGVESDSLPALMATDFGAFKCDRTAIME